MAYLEQGILVALRMPAIAARRRLHEALSASLYKPKIIDVRSIEVLATSFELGIFPRLCFISSALEYKEIENILSLAANLKSSERPKLIMTLPAKFQGVSSLVTELYLKGVNGFIAEPYSQDELAKIVNLLLEPSKENEDQNLKSDRAATLLIREMQKFIDQLTQEMFSESRKSTYIRKDMARISELLKPLVEKDPARFETILTKLFDNVPAPKENSSTRKKKSKQAPTRSKLALHPGTIASTLLTERGISKERLAGLLQLEAANIEAFLGGQINLDAPLAQKLSIALGKTPAEWLKAQNEWLDQKKKQELEYQKK